FAAAETGAVGRRREVVLDGAAQGAAADAVDDAHGFLAGAQGAVEEWFEAIERLARAQADDVELADARFVAGGRQGDVGAGGTRGGDLAQLVRRHLEAHRAALDPGAGAIDRQQLALDPAIAEGDDVADRGPRRRSVRGARRRRWRRVLELLAGGDR